MQADKPGSIRLTESDESVLLFKNDDWHGGALFIRGKQTVDKLGSAKEGGRFGFGNSIRSVRVSPFTLRLNVTVVKNGNDFPGIWSEAFLEPIIEDIVKWANTFYTVKHALLKLEIARITHRNDPEHFNLTKIERWKFPGDWKQKNEVDVIFVNQMNSGVGLGRKPGWGETIVLSVLTSSAEQLSNQDIAGVLLHELGHYLGLGHPTADKNENNLMYKEGFQGDNILSRSLFDDQIREMHDRLANHHTRRGDRRE